MTLDFYFVRRFLYTLFLVTVVVFALAVTIDTIDILGSIRAEDIGFSDALWLSSLRVPDLMVTVFPIVVMISSLSFCMALSRSNEFVISRASGRPMLSTLIGPGLITLIIGTCITFSFAPISGKLFAQYDSARAQYTTSIENRIQVTSSGLWLREANEDEVTVINALGSSENGSRLVNVTVFKFGVSGRLLERIEASNGYLRGSDLLLTNAKLWEFKELLDNPELSAQNRGVMRLSTNLTSAQIIEGQPTPKSLFIWELPAAIENLERSGSSSLSHKIHLSAQLAAPFMYVAMFIVGTLFTLRTNRMANRGIAVIGAITLGFVLFFFQRTSQTFGEAGDITIIAATWAPPMAAVLGGIAWLLHVEDG